MYNNFEEFYYKLTSKNDNYDICLNKKIEDIVKDNEIKDKIIFELANIVSNLSFELKLKESKIEN